MDAFQTLAMEKATTALLITFVSVNQLAASEKRPFKNPLLDWRKQIEYSFDIRI